MLLRETQSLGPRPAPVLFSLAVHLALLSWVALSPRGVPERSKSLYRRVFEPNEKKLVWYRFSRKLPDISSPEPEQASKQMRAETLHPQTMISRPKTPEPGKQMAWVPAPELKMKQDLKAPNLMAFEKIEPPAPRPQPRPFTPPPASAPIRQPIELPQAPALRAARLTDAKLPVEQIKAPRPAPKPFTPPSQIARRTEAPALPSAPALAPTVAANPAMLPPLVRPAPRAFVPPPKAPPRADATLMLPAAPALAPTLAANPAMLPQPVRPTPRAFVPPAANRAVDGPPVLSAAAPTVPAGLQPGQAVVVLAGKIGGPSRPAPKQFMPPSPARTGSVATGTGVDFGDAPQVASGTASLTAIVAGLEPASSPSPVIPTGSRAAAFSAGPKLSAEGGSGERGPGRVLVPGLTVRGGAKAPEPTLMARSMVTPTSRENLLEIARSTLPARPSDPVQPRPLAPRVSSAPDVIFDGRIVYTMAIQMPNITSYSGSWMVWFAERAVTPEDAPGVSAPVPLRKVDPVYDLSAVEERVEGKVRLVAIIRKDGHVDAVTVLQGADPRLDRSAMAALRKWEFQPARRNGRAIEVDAIVEIPFRLAPRPIK